MPTASDADECLIVAQSGQAEARGGRPCEDRWRLVSDWWLPVPDAKNL